MNEYDIQDNIIDDDNEIDDASEEFEITEEGGKVFALEPESDDEDAEDDRIRPTDSLLIVAITEEDFSHLEIHVYTEEGTIFVHHDIVLPEFPLCVAWCDCPPYLINGSQIAVGNFVAVGTFDPSIEIWNLDVLDPLEPTAVLGGIDKTSTKSKKSSKKSSKSKTVYLEGSHEDSVMSLSWNSVYRQALASGSADKTVKIWDITTQKCSHTFSHHSDKVQSVQFHPTEGWLLGTGGFDKSVVLLDCRTASISSRHTVSADLEAMTWNPFNTNQLFCSLENGDVSCIDIRRTDSPLYTFKAHDKTTSSISFSHSIPGMLATASIDKTVKIWDVEKAVELNSQPDLIAYKSVSVGKLFSVQFYQNNPFLLAAGGDKGVVAIWETDETTEIKNKFENRVVASAQESIYSNLVGKLENLDISPTIVGSSNATPEIESSSNIDALLVEMDVDDINASIAGNNDKKKEKKSVKNKVKKNKNK